MSEKRRKNARTRAGLVVVGVAAVLTARGLAPTGRPSAQSAVSLTASLRYVANAGVLLTIDGAVFLIDAPVRAGIPPYATNSEAEQARLEQARPPYDRVDAILVTHWHEDHFSAEAVAAHLTHNTRALLVSSPEVVERVLAVSRGLDSRVRAALPPPGTMQGLDVRGVPVRVLRIRHNPSRRLPEQHVGFAVGKTLTVLHTGDADPAADNFVLLRGMPPVGLLLAPFWFMQGANRDLVTATIVPRQVAALHVPPADGDRVSADLRQATPPTVVLTRPASDVVLPAPPK